MALDYSCNVAHTAVANFYNISVKYLMQCGWRVKMFVD